MKVVFLMEAGIPSYRNFLFQELYEDQRITDLIVVHNGKVYNGKKGNYKDVKVPFIGNNKLGLHLGILKYLFQADVIVSSYNLRIISCWLPAIFFRNKWIFWGKGLGNKESFLIKYLRKFSSKFSRYILVYNEIKKQEIIEKLQLPKEKVIAYNNTIYISNPLDYSNEIKKYFLYFGRIQQRKGLLELIESYNEYVQAIKKPKYKLRFVGDGDFKEILIKRVQELNIEQFVEFYPGVYKDDEIASYFKEAVMYVSPYNVGLAVINSFAYGVPVLTCTKPQVGPEFYYLNDSNSIIVKSIKDFKEIFINSEDLLIKFKDISTNYSLNLHHSNMLKHFKETIIKVGNE